jgi:hypothetical protein
MKTLFKKIKIWFWWNYGVKKNEFHPSLMKLPTDHNKVAIKREIAHLLDMGYVSIWELPKQIVEKF